MTCCNLGYFHRPWIHGWPRISRVPTEQWSIVWLLHNTTLSWWWIDFLKRTLLGDTTQFGLIFWDGVKLPPRYFLDVFNDIHVFCVFNALYHGKNNQPSQANLSFMVMVSISFFMFFFLKHLQYSAVYFFDQSKSLENDICSRQVFGFCRVYTVECLAQFHTFISVMLKIVNVLF